MQSISEPIQKLQQTQIYTKIHSQNPSYKMSHPKPSQPSIKLNYFYCQKGSLHQGEVLNYVCIQKSCLQKGLLCSVCKNDHPNHNVIPLKYLLSALKSRPQSNLSSESFQSELEELEKLKNSFLYELKIVVQKFAEQIHNIEEKIVQQFKQKKTELMSQIEMSMKFNEIVEETINNKVEDQSTFEKDFRLLAGLVEQEGKKQSNGSMGNIVFSLNLKKIIADYENSYKSFSQKINSFLESSHHIMNFLLEPSKSQSNQLPNPPLGFPLEQPAVTIPIKTLYAFSPTYKTNNITLSSNNTVAECNAASSERFALVDGEVIKKGSIIRFKIEKHKNWIGLGLAIRNNIASKSYQFLYNSVGHGSFLLSSNGYSWSHSSVGNNLVLSQFTFFEGNIIRVQTNQTELIFTNQSLSNKVHKLPIALNENEWKEACFCINLTSAGDKVAIL